MPGMFRTKYLDYAELMQQVREWSSKHPELVRLESLGKTAEGRDIPVVVIGRDPDEIRPAVWIDGNMHASELCGSSVALAIAEDIIGIHLGARRHGNESLPAHMAEAIKRHALLRRAAHLARRRRGGDEDRPLRALEPGRRAPAQGPLRTGKPTTSTATAAWASCARRATTASWSSFPSIPA